MISRPRTSKPALLGALLGALFLPAGAAAEYYVPPANSAANQYTETLPSAGGDKGGKSRDEATPAETLGARNAKRLEDQGAAGEAAAQLAAETAPAVEPSGGASGNGAGGGGSHGGGRPGSGGGQPSGGGGSSGGEAAARPVQVDQPSGSSALGEIVRQATGSGNDGSLGLWLPLVILLTVAGSIAYGARHRRDRTA